MLYLLKHVPQFTDPLVVDVVERLLEAYRVRNRLDLHLQPHVGEADEGGAHLVPRDAVALAPDLRLDRVPYLLVHLPHAPGPP